MMFSMRHIRELNGTLSQSLIEHILLCGWKIPDKNITVADMIVQNWNIKDTTLLPLYSHHRSTSIPLRSVEKYGVYSQ